VSDGTLGMPAMTRADATGPPWDPAPPPDRATPPARPPSRQARRRRGGWWASLPYLAVLAGVAAALWWTWDAAHRASTAQSMQQVRGGTLALAGALFVAALARLVLPEEWAGMLASRKRLVDVVTLVVLAAGLLAAGFLLTWT
jgi:Protein of unknown function (DUF3017)